MAENYGFEGSKLRFVEIDVRPKTLVEQLVVVEQSAFWLRPNRLIATSLNGEMLGGLVVLIVAQNVYHE